MAFVRVLGKFLISVGVGILIFVWWVLWGTGAYTRNQQDNVLTPKFDALPEVSGGDHLPPKDFDPDPGDPVFRLKIPKIDLNKGKGFIVVEGVDEESLKLGPGHYPDCDPPRFVPELCTEFPEVWPGEEGRVVISGHRTTYLHPFYDIDKLDKGDKILVDTKWGDFTYEVTEQRAVLPTDPTVVIQKDGRKEIVLTTCNPKYSASQRLITYARQVAVR
ncbi:MAG TPA: sortase [Actinomycetota bacterium]|nr:sortase [Actinomycetota bacterium]